MCVISFSPFILSVSVKLPCVLLALTDFLEIVILRFSPQFLFSMDLVSTGFFMDELKKFCCPNKKCSAFGIRDGENKEFLMTVVELGLNACQRTKKA